MSQPDGGPAFSRPWSIAHDGMMKNWWREAQSGMSLRDYFAAAAVTGLLAGNCKVKPQGEGYTEPLWYYVALVGYEIADAMLQAREAAK